MLVRPGNSKLGKGVWQISLSPLLTCPGASEWCSSACYALKGHFLHTVVKNALERDTNLLMNDPEEYERVLNLELQLLPAGSVVRWHVAGDIFSADHAELLGRIAKENKGLRFYGYTRSWTLPWSSALLDLGMLLNVTLWASTDPAMGSPPWGYRDARVFDTHEEAVASGRPICPEQTGKRDSCASCGLCWNAKEGANLAFIKH